MLVFLVFLTFKSTIFNFLKNLISQLSQFPLKEQDEHEFEHLEHFSLKLNSPFLQTHRFFSFLVISVDSQSFISILFILM